MIRDDLPFQVASYRRSGTHLLLATLHRSFRWPADVGGNIGVPDGPRWYATGEETAFVPWADLFAAHIVAEHVLTKTTPAHIVYLWRQPADVMLSLWRFAGRKGSFRAFAMRHLPQWEAHVLGYVEWRPAVLAVVEYADLCARPLEVVRHLSDAAGVAVLPSGTVPVRERVGWLEPEDMPPKAEDRAAYLEQSRMACAACLDLPRLRAAGVPVRLQEENR